MKIQSKSKSFLKINVHSLIKKSFTHSFTHSTTDQLHSDCSTPRQTLFSYLPRRWRPILRTFSYINETTAKAHRTSVMGMHLRGGRPGAVSKRNFSLVRVVPAAIIGTPSSWGRRAYACVGSLAMVSTMSIYWLVAPCPIAQRNFLHTNVSGRSVQHVAHVCPEPPPD